MNKSKFIEKVLIVIPLLYLCYWFSYGIITDLLIKRYSVLTKAAVIDKENTYSAFKDDFTYSYQFQVNGKSYERNSDIFNLKVGDSIYVEYVRFCPYLNKSIKN